MISPVIFLSDVMSLKILFSWPFLAVWIGFLAFVSFYLFYKYRQKQYFMAEYTRATMAYFNLAKKLGQTGDFQSESMTIHHELDSIQNNKPKEGLRKLANINHRINQLKLKSEATGGK